MDPEKDDPIGFASPMRRTVVALALMFGMAGCSDSRPRAAPPNPVTTPEPPMTTTVAPGICWGDYSADGERNGPFGCASDGVTPVLSRPLPYPGQR